MSELASTIQQNRLARVALAGTSIELRADDSVRRSYLGY